MRLPVLIGFADSLAAIESAWCLSDEGFEVHAFAREGGRPALARSKAIRVVSITPPEKDAYQSAADLAAVAQDIGAAVVLPLDDHAVWLCDYAFRERASAVESNATSPVIVAGPLDRSALLALDKREQLLHAAAAGFAVPASRDAASERPPDEGPWMVKPALAVELRDDKLRRPAGRMASTYEQIQNIVVAIGGPAIVQPLLTGTGEGVFGLATADGVVALSAHRRIRMMNPRGSGSSACRSIPVAEDLIRPVQDFIAASGLRGLFMVELLRDNKGQPWFMELNGRAWGSMALACHRGLAYPAWAVRSALDTGFVPSEPADTAHITARHLGREIVHLGAVLTHGGAPRLSTALEVLTLRRDERWYNWRSGQVSVFAADSWATVRNQLRRGRSA
jgi:biotin carboxylase